MIQPQRLASRIAFVTGASRGIGEAIARRFAAEGARVVLAARNREASERHAAELRAAGHEAVAALCDVTDRGSIALAIATAVARWGRLDVLVNNAGVGGATPLDDPDDEHWDRILATNLTAAFRVTREASPFLPEGGRVINLSSVLGRFGVAGYAAYAASKHGIIGLTRSLALELAPRKITVNAICPGWVETEMALQRFVELGMSSADADAQTPTGRITSAAEIAETAFFLTRASAGNITGQTITVDGGATVAA